MYHVLLPVDAESEKALNAAEAITDLPDATGSVEVTVLNVFEEFDINEEGGRASSEEIFEQIDPPESFDELSEYFRQANISAEFVRDHGDPAETILEVANELDVDGIFIPGRKRSPVGKAVFGSVTQDVLLRANRPVTVAIT